ncbi:MAG: glycosyltransferase family 39 protein [Tepidisphaeraceae bacterium]
MPVATVRHSPQFVSASTSAPARISPAVAGVTLIALVVVALALRVGAIIYLKGWETPRAMEHSAVAMSLATDGVFAWGTMGTRGPTSVQSPTYGFLLAGCFKLLGVGSTAAYGAMLIFNAVLGAVSVGVVYALCRTLGFGRAVGLLAAAMLAVWPTQVYATTVAQAIAVIICLTAGAITLFYKAVDTLSLGHWVGFSVLGCIAALTEPILLPFMGLSGVLILFWRGVPLSFRIRNALILFITAIVVLGPWTLRNYEVHHKLIVIKSQYWWNLFKTNNPYATGTDRLAIPPEKLAQRANLDPKLARDDSVDQGRQFDTLSPEQYTELFDKTEIQREPILERWVKQWCAENPGRVRELIWQRFIMTVWYDPLNPQANKAYVVSRTVLALLSPIGLVIAIVYRRRWLMPALAFGLAVSAHSMTIAAARFIFPHEPWQVAMVAVLLVAIASKMGLLRRSDLLDPSFNARTS